MDEELERFKTAINLSEYAAAQGYELDKREAGRAALSCGMAMATR